MRNFSVDFQGTLTEQEQSDTLLSDKIDGTV